MFKAEVCPGIKSLAPSRRGVIERTASTFDATLPWFDLFEHHIAANQDPSVVVLEDSSDPTRALLLPVMRRRVALAGPINVTAVGSMSNYYSGLFQPIGNCADDADAIELAVRSVSDQEAASVLDFYPLDHGATSTRLLGAALESNGYSVEQYFCFGNWYLDSRNVTSVEYFKRLPGNVRNTLLRKLKKLNGRSDASLRIVTTPGEVHGAMDAYEQVYRSSWKVDEPYKEFIRDFVVACAERGWLRLGIVEIGATPVASQIWFVYRGTASIFKLAYDEKYSDISAGSLLTRALFEHALDHDRVNWIDYLCGDDAYKKDWMSARRERIGIRAVRRNSLAGVVNLVASKVKPIIATLRNRQRNPSAGIFQ